MRPITASDTFEKFAEFGFRPSLFYDTLFQHQTFCQITNIYSLSQMSIVYNVYVMYVAVITNFVILM